MTGRGNLDVSLNIRLRKSGDGARATEAELKRLRDATKGIDTAGSGKLQRELRAAGTAARTAAGDVKRVADGARALDAGGGAQRLAGGLAAAGKEARRAADSVRAVDANMAKLARFGEGALPMSMKALAEHAAQVESHLKGAATAQERLTRAQAKGAATPAGGATPPPGPNPAGSGRPHPPGSSRTAVLPPGVIAPAAAAYGGKRMLDQSIGFEKAFAEFRKASGITDEGELKGFENQMVRMAIKYGVPRNDVAGMFSEASKSGIANADLGEFVRIAIAQAVGWDINPREGADAMAKTKAGMNKTIPELATLGDKINFLGDNSAAREGDISYTFGQAGPNTKLSGLSEDTTLAMLTAALSTGLHPGKTATWLSAFVNTLRNAPDQPKRVAGALKDLGYTPQEMADGMKNNADKTLDDFWERVSKAENKSSIFTRLFGVEWQDETARVAEAGPEYRKQRDALKDPKNYEGSLFKGLEIQQSTTDNHLKRFKAQVSEISDRLTRWMLPGINQAIDQTLDGVDRADKAAASGGNGWQMLGAAAPGLERDLARDLLRKKSARADGALLDLMRLQERRNQVGEEKTKAEKALPSVIGKSARKGAEARVRDLGTEIGTIDGDIAQAIAKLREARSEVERFQRENADALSGSFGAAGAQSMDGYVKAIEEGGARAVAAAQRIVGQLRSIFGFTASPTIAPNFGGAAPAGGDGGESGSGGGIGKQTSTGGGNVQVTQHIHGTDPAATARHAQREQARAVRTAMAGALHDLGSWA